MNKSLTKLIVIFLTFCIAFSGLPMMAGGLESYAKSPYFKSFKAKKHDGGIRLTWKKLSKKQQKKISGITVFINGEAVENLKKNAKSYTFGIYEIGTYKVQVKTYNKTTVKKWYNKKTGKWQKKKPKKKYRGKTKKTIKYKYHNASPVKQITILMPDAADDSEKDTGQDLDAIRQEMLSQINALRAEKGAPPLELFDELNESAQEKADDMYNNGYFSHDSPTLGSFDKQIKSHWILGSAYGENIAYTDSYYGTVDDAMKLWRNSPGHYANMIDAAYTHVGIGCYGHCWVQQFVRNPRLAEDWEKAVFHCYRCGYSAPTLQSAYTVTESNDGLTHRYFRCLECYAYTPACPHCYNSMSYVGCDSNGLMKFKCSACNYTEISTIHRACPHCGNDLESNASEVSYNITCEKNNYIYHDFIVSFTVCDSCGRQAKFRDYYADDYREAYEDMKTKLKEGECVYDFIHWKRQTGLDSNNCYTYTSIATPEIEDLHQLIGIYPMN